MMNPSSLRQTVRRVLVMGFGRTGRAVAEHCLDHAIPFRVSDGGRLSDPDRVWIAEHAEAFEEKGHTDGILDGVDAVILSPGVRPDHPVLATARERGIHVLSEIDWASCFAADRPLVAVTGTNGKTTTTELIGALLRAAGKRVAVAGNIGTPFIAVADRTDACDAIVLEVSSYQLEQSSLFRPSVAVLLNLSPDHLARHGTMEAYAAAKAGIFARQKADHVAVLPQDLMPTFPQGDARRIAYDDPAVRLPAWADSLSPHNRANLAAAWTAVRAVDPDAVRSVDADSLRPIFQMPHRLQVVGHVRTVRVINDSKSTNADSSIAALRSVDGPVVLLLGGLRKVAGYDALADEIHEASVLAVVAFGDSRSFFEDLLHRLAPEVRVKAVDDLAPAIETALSMAPAQATLLFSPGCASFDRFTDYAARGDAFLQIVRGLAGFLPETD